MIFKSIKWRLQLWHGAILLIVLAAFGYTAFELERGRQFRRIDDELHRRINLIANVLRQTPRGPGLENAPLDDRSPAPRPNRPAPPGNRQPPRGFHLPPEAANLFDSSNTNGFYYVLWARDGNELSRSENVPRPDYLWKNGPFTTVNTLPPSSVISSDPGPPKYRGQIQDELHRPGERINVREDALRMHGEFREMEITMPPGERILVGRSVAVELQELRRSALKLAGVGGVILLLGLAGGWWIATRAIRPIRAISATAAEISGSDLSRRIPATETESELGQLAAVLNSTFARLESAFARQQQFTSDAAHELRTPVSVILTQTQGALHRERSGAEYRETLEACQRAAQRMRRLIESLLELARLDDAAAARREPQDLARQAGECVDLVRPLANDRQISIHTELAPAICLGDGDQLALVITNLVANAVHYNRDGGEVRIRTRVEGGEAILSVADNGIGIAPEHLPHIFERFYRADAARTTSQGRMGLGLAITKAIVESHGGRITVTSELANGSLFEVRLPTVGK